MLTCRGLPTPVPATSTPSEHAFSVAGIVVDKRWCALSIEMVNVLVFLQKNRPCAPWLVESASCPPTTKAHLPLKSQPWSWTGKWWWGRPTATVAAVWARGWQCWAKLKFVWTVILLVDYSLCQVLKLLNSPTRATTMFVLFLLWQNVQNALLYCCMFAICPLCMMCQW